MPSTISAVTTAGTAIAVAGDTTGNLAFQTNGTTTAMTITTAQNVGIGTTSPTTNVRTDIVSDNTAQQYVNVLKVKTTNTGDYHPAILFENNRNSVSNAIKIAMDSSSSAGSSAVVIQTKDSGGTFNSRLSLLNDGILQFNSGYGSVATAYGCRAWVNFNGTGTVAIRASGNVSSITDNGTADYTINFTNAMPDANYSPCVSSGFGSSAGTPLTSMTIFANTSGTVAPTTSSFRFYGLYGGVFAASDSAYYCVSVFR
jgi:hypothetical protein